MGYTIVGIDVATDKKKRFISFATFNEHQLILEWTADGNDEGRLRDDLSKVLRRGDRVLLALDAPLGWPAALGYALVNHTAGKSLDSLPNKMFRRSTDDFVKETINKRPLDVGADRIARTAHAALTLLDDISKELKAPIPLAWNTDIESIAAIEVYPAATLIAYGKHASGYKGEDGRKARSPILTWLTKSIEMSAFLKDLLLSNDNALDSAICALAGRDFLLGNCYLPTDPDLAKREGWIWVHRKE